MEKKTCILIMPALFSGGAEKQYRYIMNEVSGSKNRVIVLLLNSPAESEKEITEKFIEKHPNIEFYQLDGRVMSTEKKGLTIKYEKLKCFFKQKKWIRKFLRENKVDIVMFSYVTQLLLVPIFKRYGIKTVFNERNTGRQICDKKFKKALLKKCDRVVANSKYAAQYVKNATGIDVAVINNGIEDKKLEKKEHSGFNVLIPARITRVKNQMVAVRALQYALSQLYSKPVTEDDDTLDYIPTQYIAEFVKRIGYDGIVFKSSLYNDENSVNVVIFNFDKCEAVGSVVYDVTRNDYTCEMEDPVSELRLNFQLQLTPDNN